MSQVFFPKHIWEVLKRDGSYKVEGLGTFTVQEMKGRETYNPVTGGKSFMKPYNRIKFTISTDLNSFIN